jgi:CRISPR/Cas system Type II protein with McrA/HNH and RuvC-like nuclease domain
VRCLSLDSISIMGCQECIFIEGKRVILFTRKKKKEEEEEEEEEERKEKEKGITECTIWSIYIKLLRFFDF